MVSVLIKVGVFIAPILWEYMKDRNEKKHKENMVKQYTKPFVYGLMALIIVTLIMKLV